MTDFWIRTLAGAAGGVLTGFGIGGGTLLLLYMNMFTNLSLSAVRGINLAYFLPTAGASLIGHIRNRMVDARAFLFAASAGLAVSAASAWLAQDISQDMGRKIFGAFLIIVGLREIFRKGTAR